MQEGENIFINMTMRMKRSYTQERKALTINETDEHESSKT